MLTRRYSQGRRADLRSHLSDLPELNLDVVRRLPTLVRILAQTDLYQTLERRRCHRLHGRNWRRLALHHRSHCAGRSLAFERSLTGYHLVEHRAEGENVCTSIGLL